MTWTKQGNATIAPLTLRDGRTGNAVVVGPRDNPKGAVLLVAAQDSGEPESIPLQEAVELLRPDNVIDILGMQARLFS